MNYTIRSGDTLWDLSRKHGIPLQDLLRQVPDHVRKDPRKLQPGMTLTLPGANQTAPRASQPAPQGNQWQRLPQQQSNEIPQQYRDFDRPNPNTQAPSTLQRLYREAPEQILKMLEGAPPTQMAAGIGRGIGTLTRGNPLERIGEQIYDPLESLYQRGRGAWDDRQAGRQADMLQRRQIDDALSGGADRSPETYQGLLPGQRQVQRIVDSGGGGNIPLQPDVGRMAQSNPNMSLESLHRFMGPGEPMSTGTTVRPNPMRVANMPYHDLSSVRRGYPYYGGQMRRRPGK